MAVSRVLPFHERVPVKGTMMRRVAHLVILMLLILLLYYRLSSMHHHGPVWLIAFTCESWFTFLWLLNINAKWNVMENNTYPERISKRGEDHPAVDTFVTTADPKLEPPIVTVNTVLSLLALEYPAEKLACYVSDDACSPITYYALVEAADFARSWVPFCKRYNVRVRAPFAYFSSGRPEASGLLSSDFLRDWAVTKRDYEELSRRIEEAARAPPPSPHLRDEAANLFKYERGNHPSIVKVIWENQDSHAHGIPHLIYVAREKRPKHPHHYKAGAMNALTRVSGVITNAPIMLNLDCDMFVNNPEVVLHAMCLLLGFDSDRMSGFVQCPQTFYGGPQDDPFGNQFVVFQRLTAQGMDGLQGPTYQGTGCFHRRKVIYGVAPPELDRDEGSKLRTAKGRPSPQQVLERRLGTSMELQKSAADIIGGASKTTRAVEDPLHAKLEAAREVARCTYELNTCWGRDVGFIYGSTTEDIMTGLRIHAMGWRSVLLWPDPPGFLGSAPVGGPAIMTQYKRWATGLLEVLIARNGPLFATFTEKLDFRQCLVYLLLNVWALRSVPELCYILLAPYCAVTNTYFLPKGLEPMMVTAAALFIFFNAYMVSEYLECGLSVRAWWNNQRMTRIFTVTALLFGLLSVVLKVLGVSETTFEVTRKDQTISPSSTAHDGEDLGRFTFDASPLFIPGTTVMLLNMAALLMILMKMLGSPLELISCDGPGMGELVCSGWVVLSFWPFVRGLVGKGSYGLPRPIIAKACMLGSLFLLSCKWAA